MVEEQTALSRKKINVDVLFRPCSVKFPLLIIVFGDLQSLLLILLNDVAEIYHFQHERVIDFREMMKHFLDEQLNFYKEVRCVSDGNVHHKGSS